MNSLKLESVAVIGAGTMGAGIAQWFCQQGVEAQLVDLSPDALKQAIEKIEKSWDKLLQKGKFSQEQVDSFKKNLSPAEVTTINTDTDLVIEAIVENLEVKQKLFANLDESLSGPTVLATNTSSLSIDAISTALSTDRQKKFIGLHFFNPAPIMKLVEVVSGSLTDCRVADFYYQWFQSKDKKPAHCKDSPGFIVNRVARNFYGESLRCIKRESSSEFKEIDDVMKTCGGFRMGPFELMDLIGVDVNLDVTTSVWNSFLNEPRFAPHRIQKKLVNAKRFGKKSGQGFYNHE